jgi:hypothetical protein
MLADLAGFVDDSVADITRLKEVVLSAIHDRFVGHDILCTGPDETFEIWGFLVKVEL